MQWQFGRNQDTSRISLRSDCVRSFNDPRTKTASIAVATGSFSEDHIALRGQSAITLKTAPGVAIDVQMIQNSSGTAVRAADRLCRSTANCPLRAPGCDGHLVKANLLMRTKISDASPDFVWALVYLLTLLPTYGFARDFQSDDEIATAIVQESRQEYYATGHPCACPDDHMRNGRICGNVSAYIRPRGAQPLCYVKDVTPTMILNYRARHND
jgi:hypothetical protein